MLSQEEYEDISDKLKNMPSSITGKTRQHVRQLYRKKLKEHYYASHYPPFQPSPYELIFINYKTTEKTLIKLIKIINSSTNFVLDTESIGEYGKLNKPALIQLQIITRELNTYMVLIEVHHLPKPNIQTFTLIQDLFESLFQPKNTIYIWGEIEELEKFTQFSLFSPDQIYLFNYKNLQKDFKLYWYQHHPHDSTAPICICESCIGIQANNPWGIQDAAGYQLHKWLDKRLTRSPFNIGLDPNLVQLNSNQLEYREIITRYAAYDCDAMFQLLISMDLIDQYQQQQSPKSPTIQEEIDAEIELMLFDNEQHGQRLFEQQTTTLPSTIDTTNDKLQLPSDINNELIELSIRPNEQMSDNNYNEPCEQQPQQTPPAQLQQTPPVAPEPKPKQRRPSLTEEEKRKRNRASTLRQRRRYYRYEIKRKNIDQRFTIRNVKDILRQRRIPFTAVNFSTSFTTGQQTLYIGIKDASELKTIEFRTQNLFTREHYQQFKRKKQELYRHRRRHDHHHNHQHDHHHNHHHEHYHRRTSNG